MWQPLPSAFSPVKIQDNLYLLRLVLRRFVCLVLTYFDVSCIMSDCAVHCLPVGLSQVCWKFTPLFCPPTTYYASSTAIFHDSVKGKETKLEWTMWCVKMFTLSCTEAQLMFLHSLLMTDLTRLKTTLFSLEKSAHHYIYTMCNAYNNLALNCPLRDKSHIWNLTTELTTGIDTTIYATALRLHYYS